MQGAEKIRYRSNTHSAAIRRILSRAAIQILVISFLMGCLSQIQLDVDSTQGRIVVSGQVSTVADQNRLEVGTTAGPERLPYPLSGVAVLVHDDAGNTIVWHEDSGRPGLYKDENFTGIPGRTYHVEVVLPDGRTFRSVPERLPEAIPDVNVYYAIENDVFTDREGTVSRHPFVKIYANNIMPESPAYIRWSVEEAYVFRPTDFPDPFGAVPRPCYILANPDPQRIVLFDGDEQRVDELNNLLVASRPLDRSFHDRHYFTVYPSSLTREAFDYWRKVDIVANRVGSIFDLPPAIVTGNIVSADDAQTPALGYFQAVNQTLHRFYLLPSDIGVTIPYEDCLYSPFKRDEAYAPECLNCLSIRNSSLERPAWF